MEEGRMDKYVHNTVVVDADGDIVAWVNGSLSGKKELVDRVKFYADLSFQVEMVPSHAMVEAQVDDPDNSVGALAALMMSKPGRVRVLEVPDSVVDFYIESA